MDMLTDCKAADAAKPSDKPLPLGSIPPIRVCDHVTFSDKHGHKYGGLVRWIGTDKSVLPDGTTIVGIEAVSDHTWYSVFSVATHSVQLYVYGYVYGPSISLGLYQICVFAFAVLSISHMLLFIIYSVIVHSTIHILSFL